MVKEFEWQSFAIQITFRQPGNYVGIFRRWLAATDAIKWPILMEEISILAVSMIWKIGSSKKI